MTKVSYAHDGNSFNISLKGHAEYNLTGPDIVCAGCSALFCTLLEWCMQEEDHLLDFAFGDDSGNTYIQLTAQWPYIDRIRNAFEFAMLGYAMLEAQFPGHVAISL